MYLSSLFAAVLGFNFVGARDRLRFRGINDKLSHLERERHAAFQRVSPLSSRSANASAPTLLNNKTEQFAVDGKAIPDVDFDVGQSFAGLLPLNPKGGNESFFFWFFPSENKLAPNEILIWLNGGPGCSSLGGLLQENGPFLWQYGTYRPVQNPWTWVKLTNVVWVEQPLGTGFTQGSPSATTEYDIANQFMMWWENFADTFDLHGREIYMAGESYAGMYVPYIAHEMLKANNTRYFNLEATMIYDPSINSLAATSEAPAYRMLEANANVFGLNDTFIQHAKSRADSCGYNSFLDDALMYPPESHPLPTPPFIDGPPDDCDVFTAIYNASLRVNPCWDVYQILTTCPLLWDVLGFPGSFPYQSAGSQVYFNRTDVKAAIHAPNVPWAECGETNVYNTSDGASVQANNNEWSSLTVLPYVIEHSKRTVIGHGNTDFLLMVNGTLLTIQNMTWNGLQGFQKPPTEDFYVPYHSQGHLSSVAGAGIMGKTHTERGLTFVEINLSGHMVPQYQPSASFRHIEFLLGRIDSLESKAPFTTDV